MASDFATWATKCLQNYSVIYKMASEFFKSIALGQIKLEKIRETLSFPLYRDLFLFKF